MKGWAIKDEDGKFVEIGGLIDIYTDPEEAETMLYDGDKVVRVEIVETDEVD